MTHTIKELSADLRELTLEELPEIPFLLRGPHLNQITEENRSTVHIPLEIMVENEWSSDEGKTWNKFYTNK